MGVTVSPSHVVSAALSSSKGGLLTLCPCSTVRSLLREAVLHKLLQCESFPLAPALREVPQHRSFPTGCSPSGTGCSSVGPQQDHKPCQQTCSGVGSSLHGSTGPGRSLLQRRGPHGVTASFRHPPALACGPFHGLQVDICSTVDLHGLQGDNLPHHGLHHKLQGKTLCSDILGTSSPFFFNDLGVCRVVSFTSSHSFLSAAISLQFFFFPFLNMLSQRCYHSC